MIFVIEAVLIRFDNVGSLSTACEDTYAHDCSEYISYCNDPEYGWMPEVCKRTCGYCQEGKILSYVDSFISYRTRIFEN